MDTLLLIKMIGINHKQLIVMLRESGYNKPKMLLVKLVTILYNIKRDTMMKINIADIGECTHAFQHLLTYCKSNKSEDTQTIQTLVDQLHTVVDHIICSQ